MNVVCLIGRVAKDVETRTTQGNISYGTFTIAVDRPKDKNGETKADFLPVVAWRQTADVCAKYLHKGDRVGVFGRIQTRNYDAQDGSKRYVTEILADRVEFLQGKRDGVKPTGKPDAEGLQEVDDPELPF